MFNSTKYVQLYKMYPTVYKSAKYTSKNPTILIVTAIFLININNDVNLSIINNRYYEFYYELI